MLSQPYCLGDVVLVVAGLLLGRDVGLFTGRDVGLVLGRLLGFDVGLVLGWLLGLDAGCVDVAHPVWVRLHKATTITSVRQVYLCILAFALLLFAWSVASILPLLCCGVDMKSEPFVAVGAALLFVGAVVGLLARLRDVADKHPSGPVSTKGRHVSAPLPGPDMSVFCPTLEVHWHIYPLGKGIRRARRKQLRRLLRSLPLLKQTSSVQVHPALALPKAAFSRRYRRYRAEQLLDWLGRGLAPSQRCQRHFVVGVASVDLSTSLKGYRDHAIFALADRGGPAMVASTYRLKKLPKSQRTLVWRRTLLHEVGHLFGLGHCDRESCVMSSAEGQVYRILRAGESLCRRCQRGLSLGP